MTTIKPKNTVTTVHARKLSEMYGIQKRELDLAAAVQPRKEKAVNRYGVSSSDSHQVKIKTSTCAIL